MKKLIQISLIFLSALFFTACSKGGMTLEVPKVKNEEIKQYCLNLKKSNPQAKELCNSNMHIEHIYGRTNLSDYGMTHIKYNNSLRGTLQLAAMVTQIKKKKYFAIVYPQTISNLHGSLNSKPQELFKQCDINVGNVFYKKDPCDIHLERGKAASIAIALFDAPQNDFMTYSANEVINYLKTHDEFDEGLVEKSRISTLNKMTPDYFKYLQELFN